MLVIRKIIAAETIIIFLILSSINGIVNYKTHREKSWNFSALRLVYLSFFGYVMPYTEETAYYFYCNVYYI